ncbi:hypothetical protein [Paracidovorax anthurii]|uniref:Uncharacterized protein n=1 Tax=Paracidovorax anthurii TaxID=78229 RepID=A0A328YPE4_9BURK|nr:hypothetical protein [Paracidovorax anthurii]RAR75941.1 hypothetical protein AX018_105914 [Paracidovorax anthurii]WCM94618.1 hypothetical protein M5C99_07910 [Acidovorax sp. NCPPB 2350]
MTPAQRQIEALRALTARRVPAWLQAVLGATAVALAAASLQTGQGIYGMGALVAVMLALVARKTSGHIDAAVRAAQAGRREESPVGIEVRSGMGSDTYHALVPCADGLWRFEFIPQGWMPESGTVSATVFWLPGTAWPVLVATEAGVMVPRDTPERGPR